MHQWGLAIKSALERLERLTVQQKKDTGLLFSDSGADYLLTRLTTSMSRVAWNLGDDPRWILGGGTDSFGVLSGFGVGVSV